MERIQEFIEALDYSLDSKRKRHIVGGILLSVSLLLGGLSMTSFTLREDYD